MSYTRRSFIVKSGMAISSAVLQLPLNAALIDLKKPVTNRLVLLGTQGGPFVRSYIPSPPASVIVCNDIPYIVDTGYGVTFKLIDAKINLADRKSVV